MARCGESLRLELQRASKKFPEKTIDDVADMVPVCCLLLLVVVIAGGAMLGRHSTGQGQSGICPRWPKVLQSKLTYGTAPSSKIGFANPDQSCSVSRGFTEKLRGSAIGTMPLGARKVCSSVKVLPK